MTFLGELAGESFELIWDDGAISGTHRLVERLHGVAGGTDAGAHDDPLAFIHQVEQAIGTRPHLVVWPDPEQIADVIGPDDEEVATKGAG